MLNSLPSWIDKDCWAGFVDNRRRIRAPLTDRAMVLILKRLLEIKQAGHDPNAALDQSTELGWRGVWPAKDRRIERVVDKSLETKAYLIDLDAARKASQTPEAIAARKAAVSR